MRDKPLVGVADARERARQRLPKSVFDFIEGGSEDMITNTENERAFEQVRFWPRAASPLVKDDISVTVLGQKLAMPVVIAPTGQVRIVDREAEIAAARAAASFGIPAGISTMSSYPLREIVDASKGPIWYQLYFIGGRTGAEAMVENARQCDAKALLVTVDYVGPRRRDPSKPRKPLPQRVDLKSAIMFAPEMVFRPRWLYEFLRGGFAISAPNVRMNSGIPAASAAEAAAGLQMASIDWDDLKWLRSIWNGPFVVKGIITVDDAERGRDLGADGIVVSNHGGNALNGVPATLKMLPSIAEAVGSDIEVLLDGGVRRGADVVKAVALGARAVLIGRAYVWAMAAKGEKGIREMLSIFYDGIYRTLTLLGCPSIDELDASFIVSETLP